MDGLGLSSSDSEADSKPRIRVNKKFAAKFEAKARYQDLQRLQSLQREVEEDEEDSDASSEDENADAMTPALDLQIIKTINSIRRKDPEIYKTEKQWFEERDDDDEDESEEEDGNTGGKKVRYKDVVRQQLVEDATKKGEKVERMVYDGEQHALRRAFLEAAGGSDDQAGGDENAGSGSDSGSDDDGGGLMVKKRKSASEHKQEEVSREIAEALGEMQQLKGKEATKKEEQEKKENRDRFLAEYITQKRWLDVEEAAGGDDDEEDDEEDEHAVEQAIKFESEYNFRFEELARQGANASQVVGHERNIGGSLRRSDDKRKLARESRKERKAKEKRQREEELKRLKNLKRKELEARLSAVDEMGGVTSSGGIKIDASMLDEDWDPEKFDAQMSAQFDDDYYEQEDEDVKGTFRKEYVEEIDGDGYVYDEDENGGDDGGWGGDDGWEEGQGDDGADADELERRQQLVEEELYKLNYEDVVGGIKTRFKYRTVDSDDFGLTTEDILLADDVDLNQYVSLRKLSTYNQGQVAADKKKKKQLKKRLEKKLKEMGDEDDAEHENDQEGEEEENGDHDGDKKRSKGGKDEKRKRKRERKRAPKPEKKLTPQQELKKEKKRRLALYE